VSNRIRSNLEVEQVGDREEHLALDLLIAIEQEVHCPVEDLRIAAELTDAGQPGVLLGPLQRGELAHRRQGAVGDQGEQQPLQQRQHPARRFTPQDWLESMPPADEHPSDAPNDANVNYILAGLALRRAAGKRWTAVRQHRLKPPQRRRQPPATARAAAPRSTPEDPNGS